MNDKFYVGITARALATRWGEHKRHARYKINKGSFYRALRKYDGAVFQCTVIEYAATWEIAKQREIEIIAALHPAYNSTLGGDGSAGHRVTDAGRQRMSQVNIGNKHNLGRAWSLEARQQMSARKKGCRAPMETSLMRVTRQKNMRDAACARRRAVICLADGRIFESARRAALAYGVTLSSVASVCRGRYSSVAGRMFKYVSTP